MIQNIGLFNTTPNVSFPISTQSNELLGRSSSSITTGVHQNTYNNSLAPKDLTLLKNFSNKMSTLYSHTSKLEKSSHTKPDQLEKNTKEFIEKFNETVDFLDEHKWKNGTLSRLHKSLTSIGSTSSASLSSISIKVEENGKLSIDENKFKESLSSNLDQVQDTLSNLSNKTKAFAMRGINTSSEALLKESNHKLPNTLDEETYYASIRKMASNEQFMKTYYSAQAAFNMVNLFV